jgi:eukaryotic-like serine/threonine-protein kinase
LLDAYKAPRYLKTLTLPPSTLIGGKYEILGLIGRGGMGSVYEGRHKSLGTPCAIKFIDAEYANSQDARSRFDTEARAAATIQSKYAIQIYDHGVTDDGRPYIVMERLLGEPLDQRLKRLGSISLLETARIMRQVARALARAHERGIIHRDLKPENIFLVRGPDDDEDMAKVLDFGIAKIKTSPGAMGVSSSTKTGTLLGTPFFMSPEQARGLRTVDQRTDLWSLGVIVFKCVTGELPFDGESLGDLLVRICTSPVPVPSEVASGLPPGLDTWMRRALDREPAERFQTATELADSLGALAGMSVGSAAASTPEPGPTARVASAPSFGGQEFAQPIAGVTSAPLTAPAGIPMRGPSKLGIAAVAVLGLALGFVIIFLRFGASKPPPSNVIAVGASPPAPTEPSAPTPRVADPKPTDPATPPSASSNEAGPVDSAMPSKPLTRPVSGGKPTPKSKPAAPALGPGTPLPSAAAVVASPPAVERPPAVVAPKPASNAGEPGY